MLPRCQRLPTAGFAVAFAEGKVMRHPLLQLRVHQRGDGSEATRAAFVVPRRTGPATMRNRLRRAVREKYRLHPLRQVDEVAAGLQGCDLIFMIGRGGTGRQIPGGDMDQALEQLLRRAVRRKD